MLNAETVRKGETIMGMYDVLGDGSQVKTFDVPVFYFGRDGQEGQLGFMGGNLRCYAKGDEVPVRTWWRKFPETFAILDVSPYYGEAEFHFIRDGRYEDTYDAVSDVPEDAWKGVSACFDAWGNPIGGVSDGRTLAEYASAKREYFRKFDEIVSNRSSAARAFFSWMREHAEEGDSALKNPEYERLRRAMTEERLAEEAEIRRLQESLLAKYEPDEKEDDRFVLFGGYLGVLKRWSSGDGPFGMTREEAFSQASGAFRQMLKKNPTSVEDFFEWNETPEEERREIESLIKRAFSEEDEKNESPCAE